MKDEIAEFIGSARWFGGKGRHFEVSEVRRLPWLNLVLDRNGAAVPSADGTSEPGSDTPWTRIELVTLDYDDGSSEVYQLPFVYYTEAQERLHHALVGEDEDPELGGVHVYDALHDRHATAAWLRAFDAECQEEALSFHRLPGHELDLDVHSTVFSGEQSNSSVLFGEDSLMKVFRKVTPGRNPDIEIHRALTEAGNEHIAALYGWLEAPVEGSQEPIQLAMLQQFLRTASDGWDLALASVRDLFAEGDLHASEVGGDFASESHRLGVATAEVHDALAAQFPTRSVGQDVLTELAESMKQRLEDAIAIVTGLDQYADALRRIFDSLSEVEEPTVVQRVHGDLHLGQILRTVKGWKLVDFEGEPAKPLADRVRPDSAWRDVAGMLRSFDYAAHSVEADVEEQNAQIAYRAAEWVERNQNAFLEGYLKASARTEDETLSADQRQLLSAYVADKAVYESVYETRNRPEWVAIPMSAIARLTSSPAPDAQEAKSP